MTNNIIDGRQRTQEEDYFGRQEQHLIERMRQRAALESAHHELVVATGIADEALLGELSAAGFTRETVQLIYLVPLVRMAWAEGRVQAGERAAILDIAELRGIDKNHPAYINLSEWLDDHPSDEFFDRASRLMRAMLESLPEEERSTQLQGMVAYCLRIARAASGLGFISIGPRICREEEVMLRRIVAELAPEGSAPVAAW